MSKLFHAKECEDRKCAYHTPLEKKVNELLTPFQEYIKSQALASVLLLLCTIVALIWAGLPSYFDSYVSFVNSSMGFHVSHFYFSRPLQFWVNDVLLTLFFFFVGLEIKREFLVGELTDKKQASCVVFSALGGIVVPALIYWLLNLGGHYQSAWAIPTATDTAYVLGILACFKSRLPKSVFTFLAALAIMDDIVAIAVIATCYTSGVNVMMLIIALMLLLVLLLLNYLGFRRMWPYLIVGLLLWVSVESAGVHGTVAGILAAFTIPARPARGPSQFISQMKTLLAYFEKRKEEKALILEDPKQHNTLEEVQKITKEATTPLQRWEKKLELPIALLILPFFALLNAGIPFSVDLLNKTMTHSVSLGIILGLVLGKPLGILLFSRFSLCFQWASLPEGLSFQSLIMIVFFTGIGFTMSLFISDLAFSSEEMLLLSKAAVLVASVLSAFFGFLVMCWGLIGGRFSVERGS